MRFQYKSQSTFGGTQLICIGIPHNVGKAFNYCLTVCNDISNCPTSLIAIFVMFFGTERFLYSLQLRRGSHGCDRMVVGFTTTYAISAYHSWCCGFDCRSGRCVQHYVIMFVSDLQQLCGFLWFPAPIKLTAMIYRDVPKVFDHCDFLLYISCKTTFFKNIIPKSTLVRFWWFFYQQKQN
jgi:hypothetical protein